MNKVAQYLQEHIVGEVTTSVDAREYFSTDGSVFKSTPQIILYPRSESDIRKTARFTWQLAERGRSIAITPRGLGTDQAGGAIGNGIMIVFPAHLNKILTLDSNKGFICVQPGASYGKVQQALQTHGQFLPPFPASLEYSTIGGAIANNAGGEKSVKYGVTLDFVKSLRVALANGEIITTGKLNKREINRKMGLATFEGEIYRAMDALLSENKELLRDRPKRVSKNTAGYNIWDIKDNKGNVDLTPLFVGSQGTLGIVTEATLETEVYNPKTTLLVGFFDSYDNLTKAVKQIKNLSPSAMELIDDNLLNFIDKYNPNQLKNVIKKPYAKILLFVEFDDIAKRSQAKNAKKTQKIFDQLAIDWSKTMDVHEQEDLWKMRHSAAVVTSQNIGLKKALPIIEDGVVPIEQLGRFIKKIHELFKKYNLEVAVWGHAGNANLHMQPFIDLSQVGERQKVFKLMQEYYEIVVSLGGSTTGEHNDGRLRGPFLEKLYGNEVYEVFKKIKQIFDPYNTMNPGVKIGVTLQDLQPLLRQEYSMKHLYDHMPRT